MHRYWPQCVRSRSLSTGPADPARDAAIEKAIDNAKHRAEVVAEAAVEHRERWTRPPGVTVVFGLK